MAFKLIDTNEVCDLLGVSKSTLYRWCGVSAEGGGLIDLFCDSAKGGGLAGLGDKYQAAQDLFPRDPLRRSDVIDDVPTDFPKPFKIGRAFKWKDSEIIAWLEVRRVK
jgi:predicted DNA-binding transcriptional regulator AlpA